MTSSSLKWSRRDFLKVAAASSAQLAGMLTLSGPLGLRRALASLEAQEEKRYLVTIQSVGDSGWDAQSFHFSVVPSLMDPTKMQFGVIPGEGGIEADNWIPRDAGSVGHQEHPNYRGNTHFAMGPGSTLFTEDQLRNDLLIWGGAYYREAGHVIGCRAINAGLNSPYAVSFSSLAAATWARTSLRPLHYVWLADEIQSNRGLLGSFGDAIRIPDLNAWNGLMGADPDPRITALRTQIDSTLASIVQNTTESSLKRVFSKSQFESYLASIQSALQLKELLKPSSDPASLGARLTALVAEYQAVMTGLASHALVSDWSASADASRTAFTAATSSTISTLSFRFALAELLITNDLSAVIDIGGKFYDAHNSNKTERINIMMNFAGMSHLIAKLKATPLPDGSGRSFLDATTLAMYTEWDRTVSFSDADSATTTTPGTGHGKTCSAILAGAGVNTGKVVGGLLHSQTTHRTHAATFGSLTDPWTGSTFNDRWNLTAGLPIDVNTGEPSASGEFPYIESLFPTMVSILGLTIPSQQITQFGALPVLKKGG